MSGRRLLFFPIPPSRKVGRARNFVTSDNKVLIRVFYRLNQDLTTYGNSFSERYSLDFGKNLDS